MSRQLTTADGHHFTVGDRVFNHYDMRAGVVESIDEYAQPDTMAGQGSHTPIEEWSNYWFYLREDDGGRTLLDGSRVCSIEHARKLRWLT